MNKACLLLFLLAFCTIAESFSWRSQIKGILKQKARKAVEKQVGLASGITSSSSSRVRISGIHLDGKRVSGSMYLVLKNGRLYASKEQMASIFGAKLFPSFARDIFQISGNKFLDFSIVYDSLFGKLLKIKLDGQLLPVRDTALLFNCNTVYNSSSRLLKFFHYSDRKNPLKRYWQTYLKKEGLLDYVDLIEKVLKKKPHKPTDTQGVPGAEPPYNYEFKNIHATSFEAQTIASPGPRGDFKMRDSDVGVALPSRDALGHWVEIYYPATGKSVVAQVIDVGPWNINDPYWQNGSRPDAETGTDERGRTTNLAGIDLSYETWVKLGVPRNKALSGTHSGTVHWMFVEHE